MLWCTRLHGYISTSLCTCAIDASPANDNDVIDNEGCGVTGVSGKIHLERCWHFCTFLHNPHFDFEPDYVNRKPRKGRFQRHIVRTEIFSTFHTWVEYISVKTVIGQIDLPTLRAAMTPQSIYRLLHTEGRTDGIKHHSISAVHCVHLADIIKEKSLSRNKLAFPVKEITKCPHDIKRSQYNCPRLCMRHSLVTRLKLSMRPIRGPYSLYPRHVRASMLPKEKRLPILMNEWV